MQLESFFNYKNRFMKDIVSDGVIVSLINEDVPVEDGRSLSYKQVFPYEFVPDTVQHGHTFVCVDVDIQKVIGKNLYIPTLYVWVFTHKSKLRLPDGKGVRTDKLCSEISKKLNGSFFYGMGELELNAVRRFAPMTDFQGKMMTFNTIERSKAFDPKKEIPSNRKKGV